MMHDGAAYAIVADIGGTFARFCRINLDNLQMDNIEIYPCAAFISLESALRHYQSDYDLIEIRYIAIAIACPVIDDLVTMTNCHWQFSISELKSRLNVTELKVLNDFTAIAMSLPVLANYDLVPIGGGFSDPDKTRVVLGAGTGLGVACLTTTKEGYIAHAGEGGHVTWGATTEQEWFILQQLKTLYSHVSYERVLSGTGLEHVYKAIALFRQQSSIAPLTAAEIIKRAIDIQCPIALATVEQFFAILGRYAGDLALTLAAFGGVYIGGGIVPRLLPFIATSPFRACFEGKGRFSEFNSLIPAYVITAEQPGMLGAAVYLKQSLGACHALS